MVVSPFDIEVSSADGVQRVFLSGELDLASAPILTDLLDELGAPGAARIEIDLAGVTFIDARGLRVLLDADRRLNGRGRPGLALVGASPVVRRLFDLTGMSRRLDDDQSQRPG